MRRKIFIGMLAIVLLAGLMGCSMLGIGTVSDPTKMTAKQFCTFAMGVYNRQYADYKTQIAKTDRTVETNKILAVRKSVLVQVYPLISAYDLAIASGQAQNKAQEATILALLNSIGAYLK